MALNVWNCDYFPEKNTMNKQELLAEIEKLKRTMRLHAGDCCSLNNEVELFRGHWEDAEDRCKELERENKHLKIWLDQYEADATELIEEHGADPDDKIDREVLKRMLNYLIGENRRLKNDKGTNSS
jgi:chromosome segregation ATPase